MPTKTEIKPQFRIDLKFFLFSVALWFGITLVGLMLKSWSFLDAVAISAVGAILSDFWVILTIALIDALTGLIINKIVEIATFISVLLVVVLLILPKIERLYVFRLDISEQIDLEISMIAVLIVYTIWKACKK